MDAGGAGGLAQEFEGLLMPHLPRAFAAAQHMARSRDDAEDILQEACLQAFRSFHTFQAGTNFKAWFMKVLTNAFLQRRRSLLSRGEPVPIDDVPDLYLYSKTKEAGLQAHAEDPAKAFLDKLGAEQAAAALQKLPEEFRLACILYFVEECTYQEIAEALDRPVGTVRSRLHRGRRLLQKMLWEIAEERGLVRGSGEKGLGEG